LQATYMGKSIVGTDFLRTSIILECTSQNGGFQDPKMA